MLTALVIGLAPVICTVDFVTLVALKGQKVLLVAHFKVAK